jgi:AcrR family transcriptional regulator
VKQREAASEARSAGARSAAEPREGRVARGPKAARVPLSRGARAGSREDRIVATAVALAEKGGFEAVRLRDVARHADVALGTLYRHFRSKEDLLVAALAREATALAERMARHPPQGADARERVTAYFAAATRTLCRKPKLTRAVLRAASSDEPELANKIRAFHGVAGALLLRALRGDPSAQLEDATGREEKICAVLQQVWFAALIGWMSGLHKQSAVVAQVRVAAELVL